VAFYSEVSRVEKRSEKSSRGDFFDLTAKPALSRVRRDTVLEAPRWTRQNLRR
jgi:hypothetical protein